MAQVRVETRSQGTVDHAVVVRQRQRQHQARHKLLAVPHRLHGTLGQAQNRYLGRVDDGGEVGAANATQRTDGETTATHVATTQFAVARFFGEFAHLGADLQNTFFVGVFEHRHHQAIGRVCGKTDVEILLVNQLVAIQAGVELRELL